MSRPPETSIVDAGEMPVMEEVSPQFRQACVEFFADVVQVLGLPRSVGQIYGLLFASARPLSFTDIAGTLDVSRGTASQGLQLLRDLGAVRSFEAREKRAEIGEERSEMVQARGGYRRELFEPVLELRQLVGGALREKVDPLVGGGGSRIKRLREFAGNAPTESGRKFSADRIRKLESWRRQMGLLLPVLKTILGPTER